MPRLYRGQIVRTLDLDLILGPILLLGAGVKVGQAIMFSGKRSLIIFINGKVGAGMGALVSVGYSEHLYEHRKRFFPHFNFQTFTTIFTYSIGNNLPPSKMTHFPLMVESILEDAARLDDGMGLGLSKEKLSGFGVGIGGGAAIVDSLEMGIRTIPLPSDDLFFIHHLGLTVDTIGL